MLIKEKKVKRAGHDLFNTNFEGPSQPLRVPRNQQEADEMMAATLRNAANRPLNLLEVCDSSNLTLTAASLTRCYCFPYLCLLGRCS